MKTYKPILGITMGDPASIGPEVAVKALADIEMYEISRPLLVGDAAVCRDAIALCGLSLQVNAVKTVTDARFEHGTIDVFDMGYGNTNYQVGEMSAAAGDA